MKGFKTKTIILGAAGAILIGAIGSGVWEHMLSPALAWSRDFLLNLAALGVKSFKDATYAEIAQGLHERASHQVLGYIIGIFSVLWFAGAVVLIVLYRTMRDDYTELLQQFEKVQKGDLDKQVQPSNNKTPTKDEVERKVRSFGLEISRIRVGVYISILVIALIVTGNSVSTVRLSY